MVEIIREWLHRAESDLDEAAFLLEHSRPLYDVAFFIHQAVEKYLKAYSATAEDHPFLLRKPLSCGL